MKKTVKSPIIQTLSLVESYNFYIENKIRREELISNFSRYKPSVPFSSRLNDWISEWYEKHKSIFEFVDDDDFNSKDIKETLDRYVKLYNETGRIRIWTGGSELTIFGSAQMNHLFRAWHEFTHIIHQSGFDFAGESIVASIQISELPSDWILEKELIIIEILGQNQYYSKHKRFLINQRKYCVDYLKNPASAILTKQS
ncbi:hypothetical protein [Chryseobacterium oryctis]|uniref:IrrE N-terminal-like domain-containing protein n=1 Tax=Chryseobacterium oryctis TaxID=2952618 RepID=A0ABT3HIT1_9FLAO|nr:hypothetical protein [Chryseobacterium oryctis]MCW3159692.1 hypothetical protein [Chryseobacterium oryctis]